MKNLDYAEFIRIARNPGMSACDDNRYAFIKQRLFDLTRWEITGEADHFVVSVYDASNTDASWNATYGGYDMPASDFLEAFDFETEAEANLHFIKLVSNRLQENG